MDNTTFAGMLFIPIGWAVVFAILLAAMIGVWGVILARLQSGRSPVPFEPRRTVPWTMPAALLVLLFFFVARDIALMACLQFVPDASKTPSTAVAKEECKAHPAARLLKNGPVAAKALCAVLVALVVPICEEFVFRLSLQGWLEAAASRLRRRHPGLRSRLPAGVLPVGLPALFFASLHQRGAETLFSWQHDFAVIVGTGIGGTATVIFGLFIFRGYARATLHDLGIVPGKLLSDLRLGSLTFLAIILPIYLMQLVLSKLLPEWVAPDPITLFFFALALGWLYFRTHRIVPSIVLHILLNATSIAMLFLLGG